MKQMKVLMMMALVSFVTGLNAQEKMPETEEKERHVKEIPSNRVIAPYHLEVSFDKTVHIIFPEAILYIDLGSANIIAGKADAAENVLRVKAAVRDFKQETNFSVITGAGDFYSFNVNYAENPTQLNIEMKDFIRESESQNNALEVSLSALGGQSFELMDLIMKTIYGKDKRRIKHIGSKRFGVQHTLKSIYSYGDILYFHTELHNKTHLNYDVDFILFKIVDKKIAKRTAIQETIIKPLKVCNEVLTIGGKSLERTVFAFEKFSIPDDKRLVVELFEKNGGRHQHFLIENVELIQAYGIKKLNIE